VVHEVFVGAGEVFAAAKARGHAEIGFWDYAKFGIPVTILTTIVGMVILLLLN